MIDAYRNESDGGGVGPMPQGAQVLVPPAQIFWGRRKARIKNIKVNS